MRRIDSRKRVGAPFIPWSAQLVLLALSGCLVLGCEDETTSTSGTDVNQSKQAVSQPTQTEVVPPHTEKPGHENRKAGHHKRHGHGMKRSPVMALVHAALEKVELTDEQSSKLKEIHDKKHEGIREGRSEAKTAFHKALVKAVEKGEVEVSSFDSQLKAVKDGQQAILDSRKGMLNELHALLQPVQRKALSDQVRAKLAKYGEGGCGGDCPMKRGEGGCGGDCPMKRGEGGCGGDCPKKHGECGCGGDCPKKHGKGGCGGDCPKKRGECGCGGDCPMKKHGSQGCPIKHLRKMTKGLELTAEQQSQVDALVENIKAKLSSQKGSESKKDEKKARIVAILDAFEKDTFDAGALEFPIHPGGDKVARMKAHVENLAALVTILTADQRKQLAVKIEGRFQKMHGKHHHENAKKTEAGE